MPELATASLHDDVYRVLKEAEGHMTQAAILGRLSVPYDAIKLERRIAHLGKDFAIDMVETKAGPHTGSVSLRRSLVSKTTVDTRSSRRSQGSRIS